MGVLLPSSPIVAVYLLISIPFWTQTALPPGNTALCVHTVFHKAYLSVCGSELGSVLLTYGKISSLENWTNGVADAETMEVYLIYCLTLDCSASDCADVSVCVDRV